MDEDKVLNIGVKLRWFTVIFALCCVFGLARDTIEKSFVDTDLYKARVNSVTEARRMASLRKAEFERSAKEHSSSAIAAENNARKGVEANKKTSTSVSGYIAGTDVRIRTGPGTGYDVAGFFDENESVQITDEIGDWYQVTRQNGYTGWVSKDFCRKGTAPYVSKPPKSSKQSNVLTAYISGTEVRMRTAPNTNSSIMGYFNNQEVVEIIDDSGNWYKVRRSNGDVGWVSGQFCKRR